MRLWLSITRKAPAELLITFEEVNDDPAIMRWLGDTVYDVISFEVVDGKIQAIRGILNPEKLAYIARHLRSHPTPSSLVVRKSQASLQQRSFEGER